VTPAGEPDVAVAAAARAVTEAAFALSRLQQSMSSRIETVNRPLCKAQYLLAHERLRNARRRHAEALGMGSRPILCADTVGETERATQPADPRATDIRVRD
jgi:hypothetical protein